MLQAVKLKEIAVKAKGGKKPMARKPAPRKHMTGRRPFGSRRPQGDEA